MYDLDRVETEALPPVVLRALQAGLRFRLVPSSAIAVSVPPDLMDHAGEGWPWFVLAGQFSEGAPMGHVGVWFSGDCSVDDQVVSLAPVCAVNGPARRWSIWEEADATSSTLRSTVDAIIGSGLVAFAVESSVAYQVRHR